MLQFTRAAAVFGLLVAAAPVAQAATYSIDRDFGAFSLKGTLEFSQLGSFTLDQFDDHVTDYALTATFAAGGSWLFTTANSSFPGCNTGNCFVGSNMSVAATTTQITVTNLITVPYYGEEANGGNVFLISDVTDSSGYFAPNLSFGPSRSRLFLEGQSAISDSSVPVVFSTMAPVPLPGTMALMLPLVGAGAAVARHRRRKQRAA